MIRESGAPNYLVCRLPIDCPWNIEKLEQLLEGYHDKEIIEFFKYGWPIDAHNTEINTNIPHNQKGVHENLDQVKECLQDELNRGSITGPFQVNPFGENSRISPLDMRPKRDSNEVGVILNLSHPFDSGSVNHSIDKDQYLVKPTNLHYPAVDDLVNLIHKKGGAGCHLFKRDMKKACRQIHIDPGDIHLLCYKVEGEIFFDTTLSMGLYIAAYICQSY